MPILTGISVNQVDTGIVISWNSVFAEVYAVSLTTLTHSGWTISTIFTDKTQHTFQGITNNTPYRISVAPRNLVCRGNGVRLAWSPDTGNITTATEAKYDNIVWN